jgi:exodeoxyribonuclease VIII
MIDLSNLPRVVPDLQADLYHAVDAMSSSGLKALLRSPRHYWAGSVRNPQRKPRQASTAMAAGTLFHTAFFEPAALLERYVVLPDDAPRQPTEIQRNAAKPSPATVAAVRWWDEFTRINGNKTTILREHMDTALAQVASLEALPDISDLMRDGQAEVSAFWRDDDTSAACKLRADWVARRDDGVIIVDGKTAIDASPDGFARAVVNWRYDLQDAWYSLGYEIATGAPVLGFVFACVENEAPYAAAAYMLPDDVLDRARATIRRLLAQYAECLASDEWPGYSQDIQLLTLPAWAKL